MSFAKRTLALLFAAAAVGAVVPLGCRQVLGIKEVGSDQLTCDAYCDTIATACTADKLQYVSREACIGLCNNLPVGTASDQSGNTLGCRLNLATAIANTGEGDCTAAGPGGNGQCGTDCESFCGVALKVCPQDFATADVCAAACAALPECPPYFVTQSDTLPNAFSIQCRLFHLTAATIDPVTHCPHVAGMGVCAPTSPSCTADGG